MTQLEERKIADPGSAHNHHQQQQQTTKTLQGAMVFLHVINIF